MYDRKIKPKYFIGQFSLSLIPLMPWIADVETALEDVRPSRDYEDSVNLKKLGKSESAWAHASFGEDHILRNKNYFAAASSTSELQ